jgi:chemotaxis protein MotB
MFQLTRRARGVDVWPGFVDALASVLLVFIFMLLLFVVAQFSVSWELAGREATISRLRRSIDELAQTLSLERDRSATLTSRLADREQRLKATLAERDELEAGLASEKERAGLAEKEVAAREARIADLAARVENQDEALAEGRDQAQRAESRIAELTQQVQALRDQLVEVSSALKVAEGKVTEQKVEIANLGKRLNLALAQKVQELNRYRSEFFGRLREVLGERDDIRIVGDRFVFQSEVLFGTGSANLGDSGRRQMRRLAEALKEVSARIPGDIDWVLRVDGHTDRRPINTKEFSSNWELSTARALSIVHFLIAEGIPPQRLIAAGFGEYHPLDPGDTPQAWQRNRRIEMRLTLA